jgi:hypothetical protein
MNSKLLSILLLLFVFSGCVKEDVIYHPIELQYALFNDKPNPVTSNYISLHCPTDEKVEFVIFGGDGKYTVSNTDKSKLGVNLMNGYLTLSPLASGEVIVTINDGHNNSFILNVHIKNELRVKLNSNENEGNIFDLMEFNLFSNSGEAFTLLDLTEAYDSIVWTCNNTNQRYKILHHSDNSTHFSWKWSNCFFVPAEFETCLLGYKNNRVISADTVKVNIVNDRDFLSYNWKDVLYTSKGSTGYHNVFSKEYEFATYSVVKNLTPAIFFFLINSCNDSEAVFSQKSRQVLIDYINSLYSTPIYGSDNILINEIYNKTFKNREEGTIPELIWQTPKSRIALVKTNQEPYNYPKYRILAEPV